MKKNTNQLKSFIDSLECVCGAIDEVRTTDESLFSPYDEVIGAPQSPFGYAGEMQDENRLVYLRARYYSRDLGTFVSQDPSEGSMNDPMSLNGYAYAHGNPVNKTDPSGLTPECCHCNNLLGGRQDQCYINCLRATPTPTPQPTCAGGELDDCDIRYLAHISAAEATGTGSNEVMAAIMLSQINRYNQGRGRFYGFRVTELFIEHQFGIDIPDEQQTTLGYSEYVNRCRSNPQGFPVPNFSGYNTALQMAQAMSCVSNPLGNFNNNNFGIANTAALGTVAGSPNLTQENSFCSSVVNKIPEWQARATELGRPQSPYVPSWYPGDANHIVFDGSPRSVVVYSDGGSPIHRNWQCPQFPGRPTVHLRGDGQCVQCSGREVFDAGIYQRCEEGTEQVLGSPVTACR